MLTSPSLIIVPRQLLQANAMFIYLFKEILERREEEENDKKTKNKYTHVIRHCVVWSKKHFLYALYLRLLLQTENVMKSNIDIEQTHIYTNFSLYIYILLFRCDVRR